MSDKAWKAAERRVAKALGGRRIPVTGRGGPDVEAEIPLEVKYRQKLPAWLRKALTQAPVVVLLEARKPLEDAVVLMTWEMFLQCYSSLWREAHGVPPINEGRRR